jgi:hypothetical protein
MTSRFRSLSKVGLQPSSVFRSVQLVTAVRWLVASALFGCSNHGDDTTQVVKRTPEEVMDPSACQSCHPTQYAEWASSMHAYASDDPLFLAMNQRGQREAQIGPFCVNCHAPMAVRNGATTDGLNLDQLPQQLKGVTCFMCHSVDAVQGVHDSPLLMAKDGVLRGQIKDPVPNGFHSSQYSELVDRDRLESVQVCGSCHDIVNGHGVELERTFKEWQDTVFAQPGVGASCSQCHMDQSKQPGPVAVGSNVPDRRLHSHRFPAVDLALTPLPDSAVLGQQVQDFLDTSVQAALCVRGTQTNAELQVVLDNVGAGHSFPSGASQDRRLWLEVVAYSGDTPIYQSGVVEAGSSLTSADADELYWLGDCLLGERNEQVRMFWEATDVESGLLPGQATFDSSDPRFYQSHILAKYPRRQSYIAYPDRVTLNVRLAPFDLDTFDSLVESGDLVDREGVSVADMRQALATRTIGKQLEWTPDTAGKPFTDRGLDVRCVSAPAVDPTADKVPFTPHTRCGP